MDTMTCVTDLEENANVRAVRRALRAMTAGDVARAEEFVGPGYLDHDAPDAAGADLRRGPTQFGEGVRWLHRIFVDLEFEEREVTAAADRVVVCGVMRGRHIGPVLGVAPTGHTVEVQQIHMFRLAGDKVVEHRTMWAELSLLAQLGQGLP